MEKEVKSEPVLHVYSDKSILVNENGVQNLFAEGPPTPEAKKRLATIKQTLQNGFLENIIVECQHPEVKIENLSEVQIKLIESLVNSVTSEAGRGIVVLSVLQLTVKAILPEQSIRLHKASTGAKFSWKEGIPMRGLDANFITPVLRKYNLIKLNSFGFMMTRSLAENYPYSRLYKASIKGAKEEWMNLMDAMEDGTLDNYNALKQFIVFLHNKSEAFKQLAEKASSKISTLSKKKPDFKTCFKIITSFIDNSTYSARMFEVAMHCLFQVFEDEKCLEGFLKPLSQMRSANKKHGNIGDIEITLTKGGMDILESWDAKYGKSYLRDELEELHDKLKLHPQTKIAGFVTDVKPSLKKEMDVRINELEILHATVIPVMEFSEWIKTQIEKYELDNNKVGIAWLIAIEESICQKRRERAPIDEPTTEWVQTFIECIS